MLAISGSEWAVIEAQSDALLQKLEERLKRLPRNAQGSLRVALRRLQQADVPLLLALERQLESLGQIPPVKEEAPDGFEASLANQPENFLVVELDAVVVGACCLQQLQPREEKQGKMHGFTLTHFYTHPDCQRTGLGSLLLAGCLLRLRVDPPPGMALVLSLTALRPTQALLDGCGIVWYGELPYPGFDVKAGWCYILPDISESVSLMLEELRIPFPPELPAALYRPVLERIESRDE
jgi:ribosomal protein S18 acetylase RimI-like enzyme